MNMLNITITLLKDLNYHNTLKITVYLYCELYMYVWQSILKLNFSHMDFFKFKK